MTQLVIIVVAAVWAAVVIPPLLRSRVENRPNSSVTDFRRQLSTLQSSSTPRMRTIGRPLAQSPLQRPAAAGRPGHPHHRQASLHTTPSTTSGRQRTPAITSRSAEGHPGAPVYRSHGDPSGGFDRPHRQTHMDRPAHDEREGRPERRERTDRRHSEYGAARPPRASRATDTRADVRRRRSNVLFLLVVATACTLFLAMTTSSTVLLYVFTLSFLATCGYVYQLTQIRRRESAGWNDGWFEQRR